MQTLRQDTTRTMPHPKQTLSINQLRPKTWNVSKAESIRHSATRWIISKISFKLRSNNAQLKCDWQSSKWTRKRHGPNTKPQFNIKSDNNKNSDIVSVFNKSFFDQIENINFLQLNLWVSGMISRTTSCLCRQWSWKSARSVGSCVVVAVDAARRIQCIPRSLEKVIFCYVKRFFKDRIPLRRRTEPDGVGDSGRKWYFHAIILFAVSKRSSSRPATERTVLVEETPSLVAYWGQPGEW